MVKIAVEEIVRLNTPIKAFSRYVTEATEIEGCEFNGGSRVLVVFGAANRDLQRFKEPQKFDITRRVTGHVVSGNGVHACLGMHLARLEMTTLLHALAERVERFELTSEVIAGVNSTIHSLASVPVKIHPGL